MKPFLILILTLAVFESCVIAGVDTEISQTNRAILVSGQWKPSVDQTQKALKAIQTFLDNPNSVSEWTKDEIKKIQEHRKEYRVQFVGVLRDGRKLIRCNFFPAADDFGARDWKQTEVEVMDGGYWYWQIEYDPITEKCLTFWSNHYA